jgi:hypothetical protein
MTYQPQPANPTIISIAQSPTTVGVSTVYTVPLRARTILQNIDVVNTSSSNATFDIYLVVQNGTAGIANALFYQQTLQPKQNLQWTGQQVLDSQQTLQINGSTTGITITMSGVTYGYY